MFDTTDDLIPVENAGLSDVECAALPGLAHVDAAAVVAEKGLLGGHVGLLGQEHAVVVLKVVVDLSPRVQIVRRLQIFRDVQQVRVLIIVLA